MIEKYTIEELDHDVATIDECDECLTTGLLKRNPDAEDAVLADQGLAEWSANLDREDQ